jgi:hypothetical protein
MSTHQLQHKYFSDSEIIVAGGYGMDYFTMVEKYNIVTGKGLEDTSFLS